MGNPGVPYHEFPCDSERRIAWVNNISRLAANAKAYKWHPRGNALVCALHFTEADYNQKTKVRRLLPSAVPTVFQKFAKGARAGCGQEKTERTDCEERTRVAGPQLPIVNEQAKELAFGAPIKTCSLATPLVYNECLNGIRTQYNGTNDGIVSRAVAECERKERTNVDEPQLPPPSEQGVTAYDAPMEMCYQATLLTDAECQTTLNVARVMSEAKKTELRLKLKLARERNALRNLRTQLSGVKEVLQNYDSNKDIQAFLKVLEAAEDGDGAALLIRNQVASYGRQRTKL